MIRVVYGFICLLLIYRSDLSIHQCGFHVVCCQSCWGSVVRTRGALTVKSALLSFHERPIRKDQPVVGTSNPSLTRCASVAPAGPKQNQPLAAKNAGIRSKHRHCLSHGIGNLCLTLAHLILLILIQS